MRPTLTTQVAVRLPTDLRDAVEAKAATEERTLAGAIRYALRQYVKGAA